MSTMEEQLGKEYKSSSILSPTKLKIDWGEVLTKAATDAAATAVSTGVSEGIKGLAKGKKKDTKDNAPAASMGGAKFGGGAKIV